MATANTLAGIICIVLSLVLLLSKGRAANLIAGYNTMDPVKKEKIDPQKASRHSGIMLLFAGGALLLTSGLSYLTQLPWVLDAGWIVFAAIMIIGVVSANIGQPFLKDEYKNLSMRQK